MANTKSTKTKQCAKGPKGNTCRKPDNRLCFRIGVYIDGTLNNKFNVAQGIKDRKKARAKADKTKGTSKGNDCTNVVHLYNEVRAPQGYKVWSNTRKQWFKLYVEGMGTKKGEGDANYGKAVGSGAYGIWMRVVQTMDRLEKTIARRAERAKTKKIAEIKLDVYGFSRGAAAARLFVFAVLKGTKAFSYGAELRGRTGPSLKKRLEAKKHGLMVESVEFSFVGLFDTVASYNYSLTNRDFTNDTNELHLDFIKHSRVKRVVHLCAGEEHRKNFSLTSIQKSLKNDKRGIEIYLPGVHSDVGGGYLHNYDEVDLLIYESGYADPDSILNRTLEKSWATDLHWFGLSQLKETQTGISYYHLLATRRSISNRYHRIPLMLMAHYASKSQKGNRIPMCYPNIPKWKSAKGGALKYSLNGDKTLELCHQALIHYVKRVENHAPGAKHKDASKSTDWMHNKKAGWLLALRPKHLHFSAEYRNVAGGAVSDPNAPNGVGYSRHRVLHPG